MWNNERVPNFTLGERPGNFCEKITPNNNFSTYEPIPTTNLTTDSGQQAETHSSLNSVPDYILGEQPGSFLEKYL
jgi:hypothetical protein